MKHSIAGAAAALLIGLSPVVSMAETIRVTPQLPEKHSFGVNWKDFAGIVEGKSSGVTTGQCEY
ncbi:MAG: hypothetical protein MPK10_03465, partial [Gammaproteobacteria bacterium]|nr:hypothetical protein [Gammaproteobacteria bacterium]